jgi:hypothetical protein
MNRSMASLVGIITSLLLGQISLWIAQEYRVMITLWKQNSPFYKRESTLHSITRTWTNHPSAWSTVHAYHNTTTMELLQILIWLPAYLKAIIQPLKTIINPQTPPTPSPNLTISIQEWHHHFIVWAIRILTIMPLYLLLRRRRLRKRTEGRRK